MGGEQILVLGDACDLTRVSTLFEALGWTRQAVPAAQSQAADDRVLASWVVKGPHAHAGDHASLVDDGFVQAVFLDSDDGTVLDRLRELPHWTTGDVARKLTDPDWQAVVQGIRAAALMGDPALFVPLARLRHRPEEAVRVEAVSAMQRLLPTLLSEGRRLLKESAAQQRGAHPLWSEFGPPWLRRQILRWLLHDNTSASPGVESVLRAALADPDWEVRVGAIIGVIRWRVRSLAGLVEHCELPSVSRDGPDAQDRALLRELHRVACALLAGRVPPVLDEQASPKLRVMDRLARCLQAPVALQDVTDHIALVVHALTTPVPSVPSPVLDVDPSMPTVWVPEGLAFQGEGLSGPVERFRVAGFHVAVDPVEVGARVMGAAAVQTWLDGQAGQWRLPTVAEWLRTVRGNDGRLFPWGNGWQHDAAQCPGPWGTWAHGEHPEWAVDPSGSWCRCGPLPRQIQSADGPALLRPVLLRDR